MCSERNTSLLVKQRGVSFSLFCGPLTGADSDLIAGVVCSSDREGSKLGRRGLGNGDGNQLRRFQKLLGYFDIALLRGKILRLSGFGILAEAGDRGKQLHLLFREQNMDVCVAVEAMSDVKQSTLDNIVRGLTKNPRVKTLHKIALALNMTLAEFLDFTELNEYSFEDDDEE